MRKMVLLVAMLAMVLATASVAYAAIKRGDAGDNYLRETCRDDTLIGRAGADILDANNCGDDEDLLYGNRGNDRLLANDGDREDAVVGGGGRDICVVDALVEAGNGCDRVLVRGPSS
jgi:Ca2+-binding RTX toxin-like protein